MIKNKAIKGVYVRISPSGKRYVGIAFGEFGIAGRWQRENNSALNPNSPDYKNKLSGAIRKHGANAFVNKILVITNDKEYMKMLEKQLIAAWNLKNDNYGYNMTDGGDSNYGCKKLTIEEKAARKAKMIENGTWNKSNEMRKNKPLSDELKNKISITTKEAMKSIDMKEACKRRNKHLEKKG